MNEHGRGVGKSGKGGGFVDGFEEGGEGEDDGDGEMGFVAILGEEFGLLRGGAGGFGEEGEAEGLVNGFGHFDLLSLMLFFWLFVFFFFSGGENSFFFFGFFLPPLLGLSLPILNL